jgi:hypothetical protein
MGRMSELDMDLQTISSIMGAPLTAREISEHSTAMAVYELMSATKTLSELGASIANAPLVKRELNDIELAYTRLGRLLSRLRLEQVNAA